MKVKFKFTKFLENAYKRMTSTYVFSVLCMTVVMTIILVSNVKLG